MFTIDPRDLEETPLAEPEKLPPPKTSGPEFTAVEKQFARPCYICSYACVEVAKYPKYEIFLHWYCWKSVALKS